MPDIDRAIEEARLLYWWLVRLKASGKNMTVSQVLTGEAQFVDPDGNVYACGSKIGPFGPIVGKTFPPRAGRAGWCGWGLEAAGPPFSAPPFTGPERAAAALAYRQRRKQALRENSALKGGQA